VYTTVVERVVLSMLPGTTTSTGCEPRRIIQKLEEARAYALASSSFGNFCCVFPPSEAAFAKPPSDADAKYPSA